VRPATPSSAFSADDLPMTQPLELADLFEPDSGTQAA
jgi:hypothetical protein